MKHSEMLISAGKLADVLLEATERLAFVGSLRRGEADVENLDIVCVPKPARNAHDNRVFELLEQWHESGFVQPLKNVKGSNIAWGGTTKRAFAFYDSFYDRWIKVNLYVSSPDTWATMLVLLSGEQAFTTALVTPKSKGGAMPINRIIRNWRVWHIPAGVVVPKDKPPKEGVMIRTASESDLFESLNLPYITPTLRQVKTHKYWINFKPGGYTLTELYTAADQRTAGLAVASGGKWTLYDKPIQAPQGLTFCNGVFYRNGVKITISKEDTRLITARIDARVTGSPAWVCVGGEPYELIYTPPDKTGERFSYSIRTLINHAHEEIDRHERRQKNN